MTAGFERSKKCEVDYVSDWCTDIAGDEQSAHFWVCPMVFSIANIDFDQIHAHTTTAKHSKNMKDQLGQTVFKRTPKHQDACLSMV